MKGIYDKAFLMFNKQLQSIFRMIMHENMNLSTNEVGLIVVNAMWLKKTMTHFKELIFCAFK